MARPRKHESEEERARAHRESQRAYRSRQAKGTARVDAAALAELVDAIDAAAASGDPVARRVRTAGSDALLRNLARYFRERRSLARHFHAKAETDPSGE